MCRTCGHRPASNCSISDTTDSQTSELDIPGANNSTETVVKTKLKELPRLEVEQRFSDVRLLAENVGAKVFVARHLQSGRSLVLKCLLKEATEKEDFYREFLFHSSLRSHPNIVQCCDEIFETDTSYVITQELGPVGDLAKFVRRGGIGEHRTKNVALHIAEALEFLHQKNLVHRDVCLENIFVFDRDLSHFKLGDFGNTQPVGAFVKKSEVRSPWAPPEVSLAVYNEGYYVQSAQDAWQLGILICVCLTGSYPWSSADITDRHYNSWVAWLKRKTTKTPPRFRDFTPRLLRLLRRLLEPKPEMRYSVKEVHKYMTDPWLTNTTDSNKTNQNAVAGSSLASTSEQRKPPACPRAKKVQRPYVRPPKCCAHGHNNKRRVRFALGNVVVVPGT